MSDRVEFWWISYRSRVQPAEVTFRNGIPVQAHLIGWHDPIPSTEIELMDRLPAVPKPVIQSAPPPPSPAQARQSGSLMWLVGIVLLILVYLFSGPLFDAIK